MHVGSPIEAKLAVDKYLGRSPDLRVFGYSNCLPRASLLQWLVVRASALTVAGQWRICTAFP